MRAERWLSRGMRYEERQNRVVKFPSPNSVEIMTTAREDLDLGSRYETGEFLGKIGRRDDIILRTDHEGGGLDSRQLACAIEREHGVNPSRDDLDRSKCREVLGLILTQALVVAGNPPARVQKQCGCLYIDARAEALKQLLAQSKQPTKISVGLGPGGRQNNAGEPVWIFDRHRLGDRSACRMSDDMAALDAKRVHQPDDIDRHPFDRVADSARIALPEATMVKNDDFKPLSKGGDLILPKGCEAAEPGDEQDGETHAMPLVIERAVTDRNPGHRCAVQSRYGSVPSARSGCQRAGHAYHADVRSVARLSG